MERPTEADGHLSYSLTDGARLIGVSRSTAYQLAKAGELETFKLGDRRLVTRRSLVALMNRKAAEAKRQRAVVV